jgi:hypothetical protein
MHARAFIMPKEIRAEIQAVRKNRRLNDCEILSTFPQTDQSFDDQKSVRFQGGVQEKQCKNKDFREVLKQGYNYK